LVRILEEVLMKCSECGRPITDARSTPPICFECVEDTKIAAFYNELEKIAKLPAYLRDNPDRLLPILDNGFNKKNITENGSGALWHLQTKYQGMEEAKGVRENLRKGGTSISGGFLPRTDIHADRIAARSWGSDIKAERPLRKIVESENLVKNRSVYDRLPDHMKKMVDEAFDNVAALDEHLAQNHPSAEINRVFRKELENINNGSKTRQAELVEKLKPTPFPWKPVIGGGLAAAAVGGLGYLAYKKYKENKKDA
jgi:hypothetical protein